MKRIVICCDGTWDSPDNKINGVSVKTNVAKIASAVLTTGAGIQQMMFYETGIGTSGSRLNRLIDGITGNGLSANMLNAYRYLVHNYEVGDELFFFGFSRGAFTVRSLAGMIRNCGILRPNAIDKIDQALKLYRSRSPASQPRMIESTLFRRTYALEDMTPIKCIGVWDTVGTLGNPLLLNGLFGRRHSFHDYHLGANVKYAYQAVAIDEQRLYFHPALWEKDKDTHQILEQVWFVGGHSDVGGGYATAGLSDIALEWMANKASNLGLGLAQLELKPNFMQPCGNSRTGVYRLIPPYSRPIDHKIANPGKESCQSLHSSVLERYLNDETYRPKNLIDYMKRQNFNEG